MSDPALLGHWPLTSDTRDGSGSGYHLSGAVQFGRPGGADSPAGALFTGDGDGLMAPAGLSTTIGDGDFSITARVWTPETLDSVLGDVVSQYDPRTRTGFNLTLLNLTGVTTSHPNQRQVLFGVDAGGQPQITDRGRLGTSDFICALAVFDDALYAGTVEGADGRLGRVFRYVEGDQWEDCGSPDEANAVTALATWRGALYAGTSHYRKRGSALPDSVNTTPGGRVYRYAGGQEWEPCGCIDPDDRFVVNTGRDSMRSEHCDSVGSLTAHNGQLYAIPLYSEGLFRYDGGQSWSVCGSPGVRLMSLASHRGVLRAAANESGGVLSTRGDGEWNKDAPLPAEVSQTYSFAVHGNQLHIGTWPDGKVHRWSADGSWADAGRLGEELEVMALVSYNGSLYGGTLPTGELYRQDARAAGRWTQIAQLDTTPDVKYRRVWSMAVFRGELFAGTLPSGHVHSVLAGNAVSFDRELSPGWRSLAAVRHDGELRLYVDGVLAASRAGASLNLNAAAPLRVGSGPHATLTGAVADVRVHRGALTTKQVRKIADDPMG